MSFKIKNKFKFKTESAYFKHTDKIADAFYDENYKELSRLLGKKVTNQRDAENYFNEKWKKKAVIENVKELTLGEHAEMWWGKKGNKVPKRNTKEWKEMYIKWVNYAFK
ncbi:hypothetical protein CCP3SC1AL1_2210011 [Gammaproteobacteria bacterium]